MFLFFYRDRVTQLIGLILCHFPPRIYWTTRGNGERMSDWKFLQFLSALEKNYPNYPSSDKNFEFEFNDCFDGFRKSENKSLWTIIVSDF